MWVLKWITVVPLATSAKPFSNIFKLSTTKSFKNVLAIQINKLGSIKTTQALSIHIITVQETYIYKHVHEHAHMCTDTDVWLKISAHCFYRLLMCLTHVQSSQTHKHTHRHTGVAEVSRVVYRVNPCPFSPLCVNAVATGGPLAEACAYSERFYS